MRVSVELAPKDPLWRLSIYSRLAEELCYDTLWMSDHYHNRNVMLSLAVAASSTKRIRIGPGVMNPYVTNPVVIAQSVSTLSELAPNRVCVGIGAGDKNSLESLGIEQQRPLTKVAECVKTVRSLLESGRLNDNLRLDFKCWGKVPIYLAAQGEKMLKLAGALADGVLINYSDKEMIASAVKHVLKGIEVAKRKRSEISIEAALTVSVDDDGQKARKTVIPYVAFVIAGTNRDLLIRLGVGDAELENIRRLVKAGRWLDLQQVVREELLDVFSISGTLAEFRERMEDLEGTGLDGVVIGGPIGPNPRRAMKTVAEALGLSERQS